MDITPASGSESRPAWCTECMSRKNVSPFPFWKLYLTLWSTVTLTNCGIIIRMLHPHSHDLPMAMEHFHWGVQRLTQLRQCFRKESTKKENNTFSVTYNYELSLWILVTHKSWISIVSLYLTSAKVRAEIFINFSIKTNVYK